jgi:DNA-directed RNA polymerase II subunit RPB4
MTTQQQIPVHDPTHRKRELPQGELSAESDLRLGEFQNVPTLSLSEARLVINKVLDLRRKGDHKFEEREYAVSVEHYYSLCCMRALKG